VSAVSRVQRKILLIADDDGDLRGALAASLQLHEDFAVVQDRPDLLLIDVDSADMDVRSACRLMGKGSNYISGDLAQGLGQPEMKHVRDAPCRPQTQGKFERWPQILKNRILLENAYLPGDVEAQIGAFIEPHNHARYYASLEDVTPADAYFGRALGFASIALCSERAG
jgi:hypothetical protein